MEEYRAGKLAPKRSVSNRPTLKYPATSVLLTALPADVARAVADALVAVGATVAATADCGIGQGCGVRIYPKLEAVYADCQRRGLGFDSVVIGSSPAQGVCDTEAALQAVVNEVGEAKQIFITDFALAQEIPSPASRHAERAATGPDGNRVVLSGGQPLAVALMVMALANSAVSAAGQYIILNG